MPVAPFELCSGPFWNLLWCVVNPTDNTRRRDVECDDFQGACEWGRLMPITSFLDNQRLDPETRRVMGVAFEMARAALQLIDRDDPAVAMLAKRIIELAKAGADNPDLLCEQVLNELRAAPPRV
jgi:hypothetical protein